MKRKMFSLLLGMLGFLLAANAQSSPEQRAQRLSDSMRSKLSLDTAQYEKVTAINLEYARRGEEIKNDGGGKFAKYRKFKSMMSEKDKKLKQVLTPDQYSSYEKMKKEMMDKAREAYKDRQ